MTKSYVKKDISVELSNGSEITTEVEFVGDYDSNYGADADGNRGIGVWFCDEENYILRSKDDDGNILSEEQKKEYEKLLEDKIANTDVEFGFDEPEPDFE